LTPKARVSFILIGLVFPLTLMDPCFLQSRARVPFQLTGGLVFPADGVMRTVSRKEEKDLCILVAITT